MQCTASRQSDCQYNDLMSLFSVHGPRHLKRGMLAFASCVVLSAVALAHDGLHEQIAHATREIEETPGDAALLVMRADLYRQHGEWHLALSDLQVADELEVSGTELEFVRGAVLNDLRSYKSARTALDKFLKDEPRHVRALQVRASVLESLGEFELAAQDWTQSIQLTSPPKPEQYVARARCLARVGSAKVDEALRGLEEGFLRLGAITSLHLCALDIETKAQRFDAALTRVDGLIERSARKDQWLAKRGDLLVHAQRFDDAKLAYEDALRAISKLHPKRRRTPATLDLIAHIKARLSELAQD